MNPSVDITFVSLTTVLLLALVSAKRIGDMQALSVSPSRLQFSVAGDKVVMCPNAAYTPKVVAAPFSNQVIELVKRTRAFRQSDQLFVCSGTQASGRPLSKP